LVIHVGSGVLLGVADATGAADTNRPMTIAATRLVLGRGSGSICSKLLAIGGYARVG
jgi:hypothetical protein